MNRHSDVLVIGGGAIGLASAYYLAKAGREVRLIERETIGAGASHGNCGILFTSDLEPLCKPGAIRQEIVRIFHRSSPLYIKPGLDIRRIIWLLNFAKKCNPDHVLHVVRSREKILRASESLYEELFQEEKLNCNYEKQGFLLVNKTEKGMQEYIDTNDQLKPFGLEAKPYVGNALSELEPALRDDLYGGWHHEISNHLRPDALLRDWKKVLVENGVTIEEDCALERFDLDQDRVRAVKTNKGTLTADYYVLATGAWTPQISKQLHCKIPIQPGKGYSITMGRPSICPAIPCYFCERSVVATPWKDGYRLGGTMEFSGLNDRLVPKRIQNMRIAAREHLKDPLGEPVFEEWVGMRPMTYDELPIIDRAPRHKNLLLAAGHGMLGMTMAPSTGKLVEEMITGKKPHIDPSPFNIMRFQ